MFDQLASEEIYQGRMLRLMRERVRYPDGREAAYDVVHHSGAVTILPMDAAGNLWFVRQYRQGVRGLLLEFPAGTLEAGEDPAYCAGRELQEEIGMAAGRLEAIGECYLAPGYSTEYMYFFLATDLRASALPQDENEFIAVEKYSLKAALEMAATGEIQDAKTLAGLMLGRGKLFDK